MTTIEQRLLCLTDYKKRAVGAKLKYPHYLWALSNVVGYKEMAGNLAFRRRCIEAAMEDEDYALQLWIMCSRDMLFFVNNFCFTYDPRIKHPKSMVVPFITYPFQDVALDEIREKIEGGRDLLIEKSRDMGASWMNLLAITWFSLFRDYNLSTLVSRNEDLVDKTNSPISLFWKVLFIIERLPGFLRPNYNYAHLNITNNDNHSVIDGASTTVDVARGGRCTVMLLDEFAAVPDGEAMLASSRDVTKCRLINSTHKGAANAFYRLRNKGNISVLSLHWSLHPEKNRGLYSNNAGKPVLHDTFKGVVEVNGVKYNYPEDYPFRLDNKIRSPWYDNECDRAEHPMEIAQELDMDPFASDYQYFDGDVIIRIEQEDVRPPFMEGELEFDADTLEPIVFRERIGGPLKLWINPDAFGNFPEELRVACGLDVSAGTGASNSAMSFGDLDTGTKIAEWADPWTKPEAFAKLAIATCKYFRDAFMIPDGAGPGRTFCDEIIRLGYRNLYFRRNEEGLDKKVSDKPGVFLNNTERTAVFGKYRRALKDRVFIQRSKESNTECLSYVYTTGNAIIHSAAKNGIDPSGANDNHGDRVIADALFVKGLELIGSKMLVPGKTMPNNCYAARKREAERKAKEEKLW